MTITPFSKQLGVVVVPVLVVSVTVGYWVFVKSQNIPAVVAVKRNNLEILIEVNVEAYLSNLVHFSLYNKAVVSVNIM